MYIHISIKNWDVYIVYKGCIYIVYYHFRYILRVYEQGMYSIGTLSGHKTDPELNSNNEFL